MFAELPCGLCHIGVLKLNLPRVFLLLQLDIENEVNNEMANRMSLFYAEATPMLKTLSNATTNFVTEVSVSSEKLLTSICFL